MSTPRRHHYCPKFYLGNFTETNEQEGKLWVSDKTNPMIRFSKPVNEAHQRDFYYVELGNDEDPYFLEKEFSKIEGGAKTTIEYIIGHHALPAGEGFSYLMNLIGLQAVRTPGLRNTFGRFMENVARKVVSISTETRGRFELTKTRLNKSGYDVEGVTFEDLRSHLESEDFSLKIHQNHLLVLLLSSAGTITNLLHQRNWAVVVANTPGSFVTSDNPVGLMWIKPIGGFFSPGFGLPNTQVTFPISDTVGLIGTFEKCSAKVELNAEKLAAFNNNAISKATRFIYSKQPEFSWMCIEGKVRNRDDFYRLKPG